MKHTHDDDCIGHTKTYGNIHTHDGNEIHDDVVNHDHDHDADIEHDHDDDVVIEHVWINHVLCDDVYNCVNCDYMPIHGMN